MLHATDNEGLVRFIPVSSVQQAYYEPESDTLWVVLNDKDETDYEFSGEDAQKIMSKLQAL